MTEMNLIKKGFYKVPIQISYWPSLTRISVRIDWSLYLSNYKNTNNLSIDELYQLVCNYIDYFFIEWSDSLLEFIEKEIRKMDVKKQIYDPSFNTEDISEFPSSSEYFFWPEPSTTLEHYQELLRLLTHISETKETKLTENLKKVYDNIVLECDWFDSWDWTDFEVMKQTHSSLWSQIKSVSENLWKNYKDLSDPKSLVFHYMLNQYWLFDHPEFSSSERERNKDFLDSLVEKGTVKSLLNDKELSGDYKVTIIDLIDNFSSYSWMWDKLMTESFGGDTERELTVKDYIDVIFRFSTHEERKKDWQPFLNFRIALMFFNALNKSKMSLTEHFSDLSVVFDILKLSEPFDTLKSRINTTLLWQILVKYIICKSFWDDVLKELLTERRLREQYTVLMTESTYTVLYNLLIKPEGRDLSVEKEFQIKDKLIKEFFKKVDVLDDNVVPTQPLQLSRKSILTTLVTTQNITYENLVEIIQQTENEKTLNTTLQLLARKEEVYPYLKEIFNKGILKPKHYLPLAIWGSTRVWLRDLLWNIDRWTLYDILTLPEYQDISRTSSDDTLAITFFFQAFPDKELLYKTLIELAQRTRSQIYLKFITYRWRQDKDFLDEEDKLHLLELINLINLDAQTLERLLEVLDSKVIYDNLEKIKDSTKLGIIYHYLKDEGVDISKSIHQALAWTLSHEDFLKLFDSGKGWLIQKIRELLQKNEGINVYEFYKIFEFKLGDYKLPITEKLDFYLEFIDILNEKEYKSEDLAISHIYKDMFDSESWLSLYVKDNIDKYEEIVQEKKNQTLESFDAYLRSINTWLFGKLKWLFLREDERISISQLYPLLLSELKQQIIELDKQEWLLLDDVKVLTSIPDYLSKFEEKLKVRWSNDYTSWINLYRSNLEKSLVRLKTYQENITQQKKSISLLLEKLETVDSYVWAEVIRNVQSQFK